MRFTWTLALLCFSADGMAQDSTVALFNGVDLQGWSGDAAHWSVEDGCLVGRSTADAPLEHSIYLFSKVEASDFELTFEYRIAGGNSGIQYRSERLANDDVAGYQADIEDGDQYSGILYESAGRAIVAQRGESWQINADGTRVPRSSLGDPATLQQSIHKQGWNRYRVIAKGPRLVHEINGVRMIDVYDQEIGLARSSGVFALQLHQGPPMEVRYRNFHLRTLGENDAASLTPFAKASPQHAGAQTPEWIWGTGPTLDNERRWFVYSFELPQAAVVNAGAMTCDNHFVAWLDDRELAKGDDWAVPSVPQLGLALAAGRHTLAVECRNEGGPAGFAGELELRLADGSSFQIVTQPNWKSTSLEPEGWPLVANSALETAAWSDVFSYGKVGAQRGPWGQVMAPRVATPVDRFILPDGFEVTLVHTATASEGSWASMTFGPQGEIYISPERGKLLRARFANGADAAPQVETLDTPVHSAQGLLYAFGGLYANVAGGVDGENADGGLHRLRDLDGDGIFEDHQHLASYGPPSEHGAHGIVLGPDNMLYLVNGNHTRLPAPIASDSPFRNVQEDVLLPRIWDPRGHANGIFAPGAVVLRTDANASRWELYAGGMRNPYDLAFSPEGELFTYDADMEWDIGTPWYRAPRVVHVVPGSESGWRSGSAKWPAAYPDSLPAVVETGPSSPVGISFGTNSNFPEPWRGRLFLGDWAYGRILAVELTPDGSSYGGEVHDFLAGKPLNVTDFEFGPDGALWFVTGGRGTQSGLYRVRWTGPAITAREPLSKTPSAAVLLRRKLETGNPTRDEVLRALGSQDRGLRFAARLNLERRPLESWKTAALALTSPLARAEAVLALARVDSNASSEEIRKHIFTYLASPAEARWALLRAAMLLRTRPVDGAPSGSERTSPDPPMAAYFGAAFPSGDAALDREIARLLVAVEAPQLAPRLLEKLFAADFQEEQLHYALLLRLTKHGWTAENRLAYFTWLRKAYGMAGGLSLSGFLSAMERDALALVPENQQQNLLALLPPPSTNLNQTPLTPRSFQQEWTLEDGLAALGVNSTPANSEHGKELFRALSCVQCHRFGGEGGSLGPDLSAVANRFGRRDLLEAIVVPQKAVSDQFTLVQMPTNLLDSASATDLRDLIAFLEAGAPRK
jgi:glucose/arabinose dehydrogenase/cytochrome c551/c552